MALKSSFKCNYKPYWLLKERLKNILCHQHWREQSCGWGKQSLWLFAVAPGHCCRQCVTGILCTGQPWARFRWFQDPQLPKQALPGSSHKGQPCAVGKRQHPKAASKQPQFHCLHLQWPNLKTHPAVTTLQGQWHHCSCVLLLQGTAPHTSHPQPYTWGNEAFQMLFQRQHYYTEHITTRVLGLPCNRRYNSPMTVSLLAK